MDSSGDSPVTRRVPQRKVIAKKPAIKPIAFKMERAEESTKKESSSSEETKKKPVRSTIKKESSSSEETKKKPIKRTTKKESSSSESDEIKKKPVKRANIQTTKKNAKLSSSDSESSSKEDEIKKKPVGGSITNVKKRRPVTKSDSESSSEENVKRKIIGKKPNAVRKESSDSSSSSASDKEETSEDSEDDGYKKSKDKYLEWTLISHNYNMSAHKVKYCRDSMLYATEMEDYLVFWHIDSSSVKHHVKYIFQKPVTYKEANKIVNDYNIQPIMTTGNSTVSDYLIHIGNDKLTLQKIEANLKAFFVKKKISVSKLHHDCNHNAWVCTFTKSYDISKILELENESWANTCSIWCLHTVPKSLYLESPYAYRWKVDDKTVRDDTAYNDINSIIKTKKPKKKIEPIKGSIVCPGDLNEQWAVKTKSGRKLAVFNNKNGTLLHANAKTESNTGVYLYSNKDKLITKEQVVNAIQSQYIDKIVPYSLYGKLITNKTNSFTRISVQSKKDIISVQFANIQGLHKCFMDLLYPWKRPSEYPVGCYVELALGEESESEESESDSSLCQIRIINSGLEIDTVYEQVKQYGDVVQVTDEIVASIMPISKPNKVPAKIESSDNKNLWVAQFEYKEDAAHYKNYNGGKFHQDNPYVVEFNNRYRRWRTLQDKLEFEDTLRGFGPLLQFGKLSELGGADVSEYEKMKRFRSRYFPALGDLVSRWLSIEDLENLRKTSKDLAKFVHEQKINPAFWKEKFENKYRYVLRGRQLIERNINWGAMYNLFENDDENNILENFMNFDEVIELALELGADLNKIDSHDIYKEDNVKFFEMWLNNNREKDEDYTMSNIITDIVGYHGINILKYLLKKVELSDEEWKHLIGELKWHDNLANELIQSDLIPPNYIALYVNEVLERDLEDNEEYHVIERLDESEDYNKYKILVNMYNNPKLKTEDKNTILQKGLLTNSIFLREMKATHGNNLLKKLNIEDMIKYRDNEYHHHDLFKWLVITPGIDLYKYIDAKELTEDTDYYRELLYDPMIQSVILDPGTANYDEKIVEHRQRWFNNRKNHDMKYIEGGEWLFLDFQDAPQK